MNDNVYNWANRHHVPAYALTELLDIMDVSNTYVRGSEGSEREVQQLLRIAASERKSPLWRNNNGAAVVVDPKDQSERHIRFGLGNDSKKLSDVWKSSDLIGITPMQSTAVGQVFGVFTAVEVKHPGWVTPKNDRERAQAAFLQTVRAHGGLSMFAQSVGDYTRFFDGTS